LFIAYSFLGDEKGRISGPGVRMVGTSIESGVNVGDGAVNFGVDARRQRW
jgi:hypothetical protein